MALNDGIGSYLATVKERDIDLLLMEEFHISPDFVIWFSQQVGVSGGQFDGAWHSVTDADGETDLLLLVTTGTDKVGILIENKIAAPEQALQAERYHRRAARSQNIGHFDRFVVCMCAPRVYLDALPESTLYEAKIAYEEISEWFSFNNDVRSQWRRTIMEEAIVQSRRGYKMVVNETVSTFYQEFWHYILNHHPELVMRRPTPKGNQSNWIIFQGADFPKGVKYYIKMDQNVIELGFNGGSVSGLREACGNVPDDVRIIQKGRVASLSIQIPPLDRTKPLSLQLKTITQIMEIAKRLSTYAKLPKPA